MPGPIGHNARNHADKTDLKVATEFVLKEKFVTEMKNKMFLAIDIFVQVKNSSFNILRCLNVSYKSCRIMGRMDRMEFMLSTVDEKETSSLF